MKFTPPVVEVTEEKALNAANRLQAMINEGHPEMEALRLSLFALCTYMRVIQLLSQRGMGVALLRRLLGLEIPVEEQNPEKPPAPKKEKKPRKGKGHGKRSANSFALAWQRFFAHPDFNEPGVVCKGCHKGGVYPHFGQWHRFMGQTMLKVLIVNYEIWRCTLCSASWPAPLAPEIGEDGKDRQAFGYSATALIVIAKYFYGTPWSRQERMQRMLDLPVSASCLNDQSHGFALIVTPIYECMLRMAGQAWLYFTDDTGVKILALKSMIKKQRKTGKETLRTGVHTSVIRAELRGGITIALFKSGILHAGEFLDEVLVFRDAGLPPPQHMQDGSSCNPATVCATIPSHCNAHARRKLEEKAELYPEHWAVVQKIYRDIFAGDAEVKKIMSPEARLEYHKATSKEPMDKMFAWMQKELDDKNVEPNSQLGGIFEYFLTRQKSLMAFTEHPGAPLDNNLVEQLIKYVAMIRKNSNCFRTLQGANDADKILTVGVTAGLSGANLNVYFTQLQRWACDVQRNPELFLPWNFAETVKRLEAEAVLRVQAKEPQRVREMNRTEWQARQESIRIQRQARKQTSRKKEPAKGGDPPAYRSSA